MANLDYYLDDPSCALVDFLENKLKGNKLIRAKLRVDTHTSWGTKVGAIRESLNDPSIPTGFWWMIAGNPPCSTKYRYVSDLVGSITDKSLRDEIYSIAGADNVWFTLPCYNLWRALFYLFNVNYAPRGESYWMWVAETGTRPPQQCSICGGRLNVLFNVTRVEISCRKCHWQLRYSSHRLPELVANQCRLIL